MTVLYTTIMAKISTKHVFVLNKTHANLDKLYLTT